MLVGLLADALPSLSLASSLADALLPRVTWPCPRYGCFAVVDTGAISQADAWFVGECFAAVWFVGGRFAAVTAGRSFV